MTGWIIIVALAAIAGLALWRWGGLPRSAREPVAAALLLGMAGYALQGRPGLPDHPVSVAAETPEIDEAIIARRNAMGQRFGPAAAWLGAADGAMRAGLSRSAVTFIKSGLREHPDDPDLWVGLGNALIDHGGGMISPAAEFAYLRAAKLAPEQPAPLFYLGLGYARSGQYDKARAAWTALMIKSPADAPWREDIQLGLMRLPPE